MKKLIIGLVAVLQFSAVAGTPQASLNALESAYTDLNYEIEVNWDQENVEAYQAYTESFNSKIQNLNLNKEDLLTFARTKVKNPKEAEELVSLLSDMKSVNESNVQDLIATYMAENNNSGLSYRGGVSIDVNVYAILGVILAYTFLDDVFSGEY